jgi:hypothetical protein
VNCDPMSASSPPPAEEIQRQMRDVRSELRDDVQEIVENARVMTDWQFYVRQYPWICLGAAAALGYFVVPQRVLVVKPDAQMLSDLVRQHQLAVKTEVRPQPSGGVLGRLVNVAASALLHGVVAIASQQMNQFLRGLAVAPPPPLDADGASTDEESHR